MQASTQLIHSIPVDPLTGAIAVPIYQTSTFVQDAPGVNKGFDYSRSGNPTRQALENLVAELEGGATGSAFASGLAAIDAVVKLLEAGDEIIAVDDIYGGAFRLFNTVYSKFGIHVTYVDTTNVENVFNAITLKTRLIWLETPTNPTLKISDIEAIARGGHSDIIAGIVVTQTKELGEKIRYIQNACGAVLGPFDSWLLIRGIETLPLRMKQHCYTAQQIAEYLNNHPDVDKVYYPGLKEHFNHAIAKKQSKGFGGIISFTLKK